MLSWGGVSVCEAGYSFTSLDVNPGALPSSLQLAKSLGSVLAMQWPHFVIK